MSYPLYSRSQDRKDYLFQWSLSDPRTQYFGICISPALLSVAYVVGSPCPDSIPTLIWVFGALVVLSFLDTYRNEQSVRECRQKR